MSLLTDTLLGLEFGLMIVIVLPLAIGRAGGPEWRAKIAWPYWHMAMFSMRRALIARQNTLLSLIGTSYNGKRNAEEFSLGGETKHAEDVGRFMRTMMNRPFGLISSSRNAIIDPVLAEIAEFRKRQTRGNDHVIEDDRLASKLNPKGRAFTPYCAIPAAQRVIDPKTAEDRMHGSAEPSDANTVYVWGLKSQELFDRFDHVERAMIIVTAFVAGYGVTWFGLDDGGGAADAVPGEGLPMGGTITPPPGLLEAGSNGAALLVDGIALGVV